MVEKGVQLERLYLARAQNAENNQETKYFERISPKIKTLGQVFRQILR